MSTANDQDLVFAPPRHLLGRFRQAMLDSSPDALADLFSPDAIYEFPFLAPQRETQRYDGREQIRAGFTRAWGALRPSPLTGVRDVYVHDTVDPEVIIAEQELDAINHSTGQPFTAAFLLVLRARHGEIVHLRDYSDVLRTSAGLGRLPQLFDRLRIGS
jgi:ketosteroid isomerase-like protein